MEDKQAYLKMKETKKSNMIAIRVKKLSKQQLLKQEEIEKKIVLKDHKAL